MTTDATDPRTTDAAPFPSNRSAPYRFSDGYAQLRDPPGPLRLGTRYDGRQAWVVVIHEAARKLLASRFESADAHRTGFPFLTAGGRDMIGTNPTLFRMDDPEHARLRRMTISHYTVKRIKTISEFVEEVVLVFLRRMTISGPTADLVSQFLIGAGHMVICRLLGVPYEDHAFFQERSRVLLTLRSTPEEVRAAQDELLQYLARLARTKRERPDDAIISRLVARGEILREEDISDAMLLLIAGHATDANLTSMSLYALADRSEQYAALRADRSLVPGAVEDPLRYVAIADIATEDVPIRGRTIAAGNTQIAMGSSANLDHEYYEDPDALTARVEDLVHLAFGFGRHQCLGQNLARADQLREDLMTARNDPTLRLAVPVQSSARLEGTTIQGVNELPVTW
uniref:VitaminD3 25-hydroxylase n=1 Tax=Pseudonocardia autotrophica TaxID=2074 RepID=Q59079_PSEAH|nr:vitaminD3 25-hydroxylase [Pseudonocardia autotrophica]prf//2019246A cytochrome P450VD25 [Pseudonocardia autotrophica]